MEPVSRATAGGQVSKQMEFTIPPLAMDFSSIAKWFPSMKIWVFVDNFAIHGPTYEATAAAFSFFNMVIWVGLFCNLAKCQPPSQVTKYCRFLLDTRSTLELCIPTNKCNCTLAMIDYLLAQPMAWDFSRLALLIVMGTLKSLVKGTSIVWAAPSFAGSTIKFTHQVWAQVSICII